MKSVLKLLVSGLLIYGGFVLLLFLNQRSLIYFPDTSVPDIRVLPGAEVIEAQTGDGLTLKAWWVAPATAEKPVIVFFHGNRANIENRAEKVLPLVDAGFGLLMAEYRGYGGNPGEPSEEGLFQDGHAYMRFLTSDKAIQSARIVLYGESLGSGVASEMAERYPIKALILEVPFSSALAIAAHSYPYIPFMDLLLKDHYRNDTKIAQIDAPVLFGIAGKDTVIPPAFGKALFEKATEPKTLLSYDQAIHNNLHLHGFVDSTVAFINGL